MSRQPARSENHRARTEPEAAPGLSRSSQLTSSYLTASSSPYISPYSPVGTQPTTTIISPQPIPSFDFSPLSIEASAIGSRAASAAAMSTYSSSSQDSIYSNTSSQRYRTATPGMMDNPGTLSTVSANCKVILFVPRIFFCFPKYIHPVVYVFRRIRTIGFSLKYEALSI